MFNNNFEYKINRIKKDDVGNLLCLDLEIEGKKILLINLYGPNQDSPEFFEKVSECIENFNQQTILITGDFNLVQN